MSSPNTFLSYGSATAGYAFAIFILTALPVSVILDGVDPSHTEDSLARNLDLAADGLNSGAIPLHWYALAQANQSGMNENAKNAALMSSFIIIIAIFVITCMEQADTQLQPSPAPDQGAEFRGAASTLDDIRYQFLPAPQPAAGQWSGWAAEAFTDSTDAQRVRLQQMADADNQVADTLQTQAHQVTQARREVAGAKLVLAMAIPGAAALYKVNPWASTVWQLVCGVVAISQVVTAYVNLHDQSQQNANTINKATAVYTQVQQSAQAAAPSTAATWETTGSASPPAPSDAAPGRPTPVTAFRAADSHPALPPQQQTPATALPVLPAGLVLGPGRATALSRPAAKRKTADQAADPAESLADTGVGEQSAEPQIPAVPIEPLPPASTGPAVGTAKEAR